LVRFVGFGDQHDPTYRETKQTFQLNSGKFGSLSGFTEIHIYAASIETIEDGSMPFETLYLVSVSLLFAFCISLLAYHEYILQRRHSRTYTHAIQSSALVASIFPEQVHERLMKNRGQQDQEKHVRSKSIFGAKLNGDALRRSTHCNPSTRKFSLVKCSPAINESVREPPKLRLKSLLRTQSTLSTETDFDKPIADYFPDCTIMFADIVDFTAWSSTCDPIQVFTLLQNIFFEFDKAAKRRGVFKVETIGASYVAVCGLPQPQKDHALVMAGFALECRMLVKEVTRSLEDLLGPNTRDLKAKFGLHSGPVIAGVLKGSKARFQLFGDTMNTASRMETTSIADRVQISESTAELLIAAGKGDMICQRAGKVTVKGKGEMKTHFLEVNAKARRRLTAAMGTKTEDNQVEDTKRTNIGTASDFGGNSQESTTKKDRPHYTEWLDWSSTRSTNGPIDEVDDRQDRLIDWNVYLLADLLKKVVSTTV
jgi:class 3 adenylate cyclase